MIEGLTKDEWILPRGPVPRTLASKETLLNRTQPADQANHSLRQKIRQRFDDSISGQITRQQNILLGKSQQNKASAQSETPGNKSTQASIHAGYFKPILRSRQQTPVTSHQFSQNNGNMRSSTNITETGRNKSPKATVNNLTGSRQSLPVQSRQTKTAKANVKHGSAANLEGVSTDEGLTLSHIRKASVTGMTQANTKTQERSAPKNRIARPQTAKHFSRPKSSDADSFGKAQPQSKSPGKERVGRNLPKELQSQRPLSRIYSDREILTRNFKKQRIPSGVLSGGHVTSDGALSIQPNEKMDKKQINSRSAQQSNNMFSGIAIIDGQSQEIQFDLNKKKHSLNKKKSRRNIAKTVGDTKIDKNLEKQINALKLTAKQIRHQTPQQARYEVAQDRREAREQVHQTFQQARKLQRAKPRNDSVAKSIHLLQAYGEFERFMNMSKHYLHEKKQQLGDDLPQGKTFAPSKTQNLRPKRPRKLRQQRVTIEQEEVTERRDSAARLSFNHGENTHEVEANEDRKSDEKLTGSARSLGLGEEGEHEQSGEDQ